MDVFVTVALMWLFPVLAGCVPFDVFVCHLLWLLFDMMRACVVCFDIRGCVLIGVFGFTPPPPLSLSLARVRTHARSVARTHTFKN